MSTRKSCKGEINVKEKEGEFCISKIRYSNDGMYNKEGENEKNLGIITERVGMDENQNQTLMKLSIFS